MASSYLGDLFSVLFDAMRSSIMLGVRIRIRICIRYVECSAVVAVSGQLQVWGEARCFLFVVCGVLGVVFVRC